MTASPPNDRLLKSLAVVFVEHPRATLKQLADAAGTSKATLHRLCGTRDNLLEMLVEHALSALNQVIDDSKLDHDDYLAALKRLITGHLAHRELLVFLMFEYRPDSCSPKAEGNSWRYYEEALDEFFLRGQRAGMFRIDITAPMLTEIFSSTLFGIVDAERRGRAANAGSPAVFEQFFLHGSVAKN